MSRLEEIFSPVAAELALVAQLMQQELTAASNNSAISAVRATEGKQLRAGLVLLAASAVSDMSEPESSRYLAAGAEFIHSATLVHDDFIDGSPLRRGRPAVHQSHGASVAILVGDFYLMKGMSLLARTGDARAPRAFAEATAQICRGEIAHAERQWMAKYGESDYLAAIEAKTATLISACTYTAALLAGKDESAALRLREYGHNLGMAFQIADDILDYTGTEATLGKPAGEDLRAGTVTMPLLRALADPQVQAKLRPLLSPENPPSGDRAQEIVRLVRESSAIEQTKAAGTEFVDAARQALQDLPPTPARQSLEELAGFALERVN